MLFRDLIRSVQRLFQFNVYKEPKLKKISKLILDKIDRLQNTKCHADKVIACSLEDNCGYACLFHHLSVCFILSFYLERTVVIEHSNKKGIGQMNRTFLPLTNSCSFNHQPLRISKYLKESFKIFSSKFNDNFSFSS